MDEHFSGILLMEPEKNQIWKHAKSTMHGQKEHHLNI